MVDLELDELKREFLDEARDKVAEMQTALEAGPQSAALDRLAYLAHQLKGSGGSYGYQRISTDAEEVEKAVEALAALQTSDVSVEAKIQQHVLNLRAEIEKRQKELA
jgi:chemotaxis protein histidine kinase CheA